MALTTKSSGIAGERSQTNPDIRKIDLADLKNALLKGFEDFKEKPTHLIILAIVYPLAMIVGVNVAAGYELLPLVFPLVSGFALIGPFAAVGLYDMSKQRELGHQMSWQKAFNVFRSHAIIDIAILSVLLLLIYILWLGAAFAIYYAIFGGATPATLAEFFSQVFTTTRGWLLIVLGCSVGFMFAVIVLAIAAISFPLLVDRDVGLVTAVKTSIRAFFVNPATMLIWGFIVTGLLVLGSLPFFVGLAVVMPVLGHATWHIYRKVVAH